MSYPIFPGSTLGILGSGQLGRMLAIAARRMGYRVQTFSPERDTPTGEVANLEWVAAYTDEEALSQFAQACDAVTFEFENIPSSAIDIIAAKTVVRPRAEVLHITQHRQREKEWLAANGIPVAPFQIVRSRADMDEAARTLGYPFILKTAGFGYDGKGQARVNASAELASALQTMNGADAVAESFVRFEKEISVVAARGVDGSYADFGIFENIHRNHILDLTIAPARVSDAVKRRAREIAHDVVTKLDVVGVLCIEMFVLQNGEVLVNELAPRTHNSGHVTFDAFVTSQFEQQLRAVSGLPLGSTSQYRPAMMMNLLGDLWQQATPNWKTLLEDPNIKLHLYGKKEPRAGRKMGHITIVADTLDACAVSLMKARELLALPPVSL